LDDGETVRISISGDLDEAGVRRMTFITEGYVASASSVSEGDNGDDEGENQVSFLDISLV